MDIDLLHTLVTSTASGAAGAAGAQLWSSLRNAVRGDQGQGHEPAGIAAEFEAEESLPDPVRARELADALVENISLDSGLRDRLRTWMEQAQKVTHIPSAGHVNIGNMGINRDQAKIFNAEVMTINNEAGA
ncbi:MULTISPECIES: hypothetical protein [Streptomyces]|uniref:hypothetical protein n=1 Tax=Streptomyces TaxID=1883 RepID=UPI00345BFD43